MWYYKEQAFLIEIKLNGNKNRRKNYGNNKSYERNF